MARTSPLVIAQTQAQLDALQEERRLVVLAAEASARAAGKTDAQVKAAGQAAVSAYDAG